MVLHLSFSFSFSANLGQPGSDTDPHNLNSNSDSSAAATLAPPAAPSLKRQSHHPNMPQTPQSRCPPSFTPRNTKRKRCRLDQNVSSARLTSYDDDRAIPETPTSKAMDRQSLQLLLRSSTKNEIIPETQISKAKDRESLDLLLRSSTLQGRVHKTSLNPRKCKAASDSPKVAVLAASTLTDPFVSVATPVHSHNPGTDLASSLQASRVKLLASYFEQMDFAAGSVIASTSTSSGSQKASVEVSAMQEVAGSQSSKAKDLGRGASPLLQEPSSKIERQTAEGVTAEKEVDGEEAGEKVSAAGVSDSADQDNQAQFEQHARIEGEKDRSEDAGEDWEEVTKEDAKEGRVVGALSWWKGLVRPEAETSR